MFFVNTNNIIYKTKDNFLNQLSSKFLFAENIQIDGKKVEINEVNNFQDTDPDAINICFSTIQKLHDDLNVVKENCITYDDFCESPVILISDEAHHLNAGTKKVMNQTELITHLGKALLIIYCHLITKIFY